MINLESDHSRVKDVIEHLARFEQSRIEESKAFLSHGDLVVKDLQKGLLLIDSVTSKAGEALGKVINLNSEQIKLTAYVRDYTKKQHDLIMRLDTAMIVIDHYDTNLLKLDDNFRSLDSRFNLIEIEIATLKADQKWGTGIKNWVLTTVIGSVLAGAIAFLPQIIDFFRSFGVKR
jgi:hypothetical protein